MGKIVYNFQDIDGFLSRRYGINDITTTLQLRLWFRLFDIAPAFQVPSNTGTFLADKDHRISMKKRVRAYMRNGRNRRFWRRLLSVLSCVVVFVTTYALLLPAITLEKTAACGIEAHQHDQSCFEQHLICGLEETDGHQHTDDCYTVNRVLACTIEEHSHTEECFNEEGELTCALAEHSHDDGCWREDRVLSCKKEETEPHHHTDTCYESVLVCQKPVHIHRAKIGFGNTM